MSQATEQTADHLRPSDIEWELFHDPHERPTTPVRLMKTDGPCFLETTFTPWFCIGHHWHPFDTLYFIAEGEMSIGPEGNFGPGDVRWIKAGHHYGPEVAGAEGVRFFLMALGDEVGLNWADLYETPEALSSRLEDFSDTAGRIHVDDSPARDLAGPDGAPCCKVRTLCEGNPYIQRLELAPGGTLPAYSHGVSALYLVRGGSMEVPGEKGYDAEDARWVPAGQVTPGITAGAKGADLLVIGIDGVADFSWQTA